MSTARATWRRHALPLALLVAAVLVAYANAAQTVFQFDDHVVIVESAASHAWAAWWASLPGLRPLLKASYVLSWQAGGGMPSAYVAFNVAVHAANVMLVYALVLRLAPGLRVAQARTLAVVTALVFALHPAQTEAVTYLSGRSTSLMALFFLAALVCALDARRGVRGAALALFACAVLVKETAIAWPAAVLLVVYVGTGSWRTAWQRTRAPLLAACAAALAIAAVPAYRRLATASLATRDPLANLVAQVDAVAYLVVEPLLLLRTNIDPDVLPAASGGAALARLAIVVALVGGAIGGLWPRRRADGATAPAHPVTGFACAWFLLSLAPTHSLAARFDLANDRQLYLALVGPALALAALALRMPARWGSPLVAALLVALGTATLLRNLDYRSEVALWEATAARSPGKSRVHNNLGYAYELADNPAAARAAYARALALDPADYKARANLNRLPGVLE